MSVAVAGGFGGLGRAIVEAILAQGKHEAKPDLKTSARVAVVDYSSVASLTAVLEEHAVHTVISAVNNITGDNSSETNLIHAAEAAKTVKRFMPSYFGAHYSSEQYKSFPPAMAKKAAQAELEASSLEWTTVYNGYFLDYFGTPKAKSYIDDIAFFIDVANDTAAIPGSGNTPVVFTHTFDVAKFVAAAIDLPEWSRESYIIGDKLSWNELLQLAQEVKGTKFHVAYDSVEKLETGIMTELPSHQQFYAVYPKEHLQSFMSAFGVNCERGQANFSPSRTLNDEFPEIHAMTAREVLEIGWGKE
ncbi:hypothetical protein AK830_g439 [Neonectria ditissima]|uniref:NmrA-like domain-containing protein n=1 Tax=Neonectria ditissima TaxID=78410 RepID=A0A0P7BWV6_9HYPO|nr:hypothetical protein AK830_g439 [Neonectria ditissima]